MHSEMMVSSLHCCVHDTTALSNTFFSIPLPPEVEICEIVTAKPDTSSRSQQRAAMKSVVWSMERDVPTKLVLRNGFTMARLCTWKPFVPMSGGSCSGAPRPIDLMFVPPHRCSGLGGVTAIPATIWSLWQHGDIITLYVFDSLSKKLVGKTTVVTASTVPIHTVVGMDSRCTASPLRLDEPPRSPSSSRRVTFGRVISSATPITCTGATILFSPFNAHCYTITVQTSGTSCDVVVNARQPQQPFAVVDQFIFPCANPNMVATVHGAFLIVASYRLQCTVVALPPPSATVGVGMKIIRNFRAREVLELLKEDGVSVPPQDNANALRKVAYRATYVVAQRVLLEDGGSVILPLYFKPPHHGSRSDGVQDHAEFTDTASLPSTQSPNRCARQITPRKLPLPSNSQLREILPSNQKHTDPDQRSISSSLPTASYLVHRTVSSPAPRLDLPGAVNPRSTPQLQQGIITLEPFVLKAVQTLTTLNMIKLLMRRFSLWKSKLMIDTPYCVDATCSETQHSVLIVPSSLLIGPLDTLSVEGTPRKEISELLSTCDKAHVAVFVSIPHEATKNGTDFSRVIQHLKNVDVNASIRCCFVAAPLPPLLPSTLAGQQQQQRSRRIVFRYVNHAHFILPVVAHMWEYEMVNFKSLVSGSVCAKKLYAPTEFCSLPERLKVVLQLTSAVASCAVHFNAVKHRSFWDVLFESVGNTTKMIKEVSFDGSEIRDVVSLWTESFQNN